MRLPLYKKVRDVFNNLKSKDNKLNLGLYHQKFCKHWQGGFGPDISLEKHEFLKEIVDKAKKITAEDRIVLDEHVERLSLLINNLGGKFEIYELKERFVTGTGLNHPVEVGFLWNHVLGVPYIAGSSIKGLARDWAENWLEIDDDDINRIFGSNDQMGSVIFFDALPYGKINLAVDIMTPHYGSYYAEGGCPGDWSNPTPIPFLTVDEQQRFIFFVAPGKEKAKKDCTKALKWLDEALTTIGAGAKTATGYGCFKAAEDLTKVHKNELKAKIKEEEQKRRLEKMTPIRREMEEEGFSVDENTFMEKLTVKWLKRLKDESVDAKEKREIAGNLADWYKTWRPKDWEKPQRKNVEKVEVIKKYLD
ncbi:MAG: type III-B CRISPR module RAMP protein Cmr6 [Firmicutes bacterium]|nr:type III-B CRISPR module RAMP protein Cmr6 [Bacillota bacterium]